MRTSFTATDLEELAHRVEHTALDPAALELEAATLTRLQQQLQGIAAGLNFSGQTSMAKKLTDAAEVLAEMVLAVEGIIKSPELLAQVREELVDRLVVTG